MDMDMDIETLRSCRALHRLLVLINHPIDRLGALDMLLFLTKLPHFSPKSVRLLPSGCLPFNSPQALPAIAESLRPAPCSARSICGYL